MTEEKNFCYRPYILEILAAKRIVVVFIIINLFCAKIFSNLVMLATKYQSVSMPRPNPPPVSPVMSAIKVQQTRQRESAALPATATVSQDSEYDRKLTVDKNLVD